MKKTLTSLILAFALIAMSVGSAFAQDETPIAGTVQSVEFETNADTGETVVVVTLLDAEGASHTVRISLETAESLGLVDLSGGEPSVTDDAIGKEVEIAPADILEEDNGEEDAEEEHPVGSALSSFFSELLGVDYEFIMAAHKQGVGFGVIAQALWLTHSVDGGSAEFEALIQAKQSGDYSNITLADGSTPANWGDVVKSLKKGDNLGRIMSGKAGSSQNGETTLTSPSQNNNEGGAGNGNGQGNENKGKDNGKGKDKDKGKENGKDNGKGKNK
jgi:hypothetical protein